MRKLRIAFLFLAVLLPTDLLAQQNSQPLTNQDVVSMVKAGLSPEVVAAKIKASRSSFDTSPAALEQLKKRGVPDSVILAMVQAPEQKVYVKCDFGTVSIHSDTGVESSAVGEVDCHAALIDLGRAGDSLGEWERVRTQGGAVGYVLKSVLTAEQPTEAPANSPASQVAPGQAAASTARPPSAPLPPDELRALAWRGVPWATTSYYRQPGSSYTSCTGQGQWLGNFYNSNLSCTGSYTPAQNIPINWYHYTIYNLVETNGSYALIACTRNVRWSKCSYLVPGSVFTFRSSKGEVWVTAYTGGKGKQKTVKYTLVAQQPKSSR